MCCKNKQKAVTKTVASTEEHNSFSNCINMGKCGKSVSFLTKIFLEFWKLNTVTLDALWEIGWAFPFFFFKALIQTLCERLLTRIAQHILSCKLYKQHVPSAVMFA